MSPRLAFAIEAAIKAGKSTLAHFQTGVTVEAKADNTPVTIADRNAEQILRAEIVRSFHDDAILGEEEGQTGDGENRWVLDPIDGTRSFISGVPLFATLIAYEEVGEPIVGVCYLPALDELYFAERGIGAFWNGRRCQVSEKATIEGASLSCGSHFSMERAGRAEGFLTLARQAGMTRTWGDAYGHMLVASGRIEAMVDPSVSRWDISAVSVIVKEAGGCFTDFHGRACLTGEAISSNGLIHEKVLEAFQA